MCVGYCISGQTVVTYCQENRIEPYEIRRKRENPTEEVKLSGKKDCGLTELWRIPCKKRVPKVQGGSLISQAKGQSAKLWINKNKLFVRRLYLLVQPLLLFVIF